MKRVAHGEPNKLRGELERAAPFFFLSVAFSQNDPEDFI